MTRHGILITGMAIATALGGCVSSSPRQYTYDIEVRNGTGEPLSIELLRIQSGNVGKVRADLANGGTFAHAHTAYATEFFEARITPMGAAAEDPRWIVELPKGATKYDLVREGDRIVAKRRVPGASTTMARP